MEWKKLRKLSRSRRGITPVLSSLLMMVIAVAGMSIAITATSVITDGLHDNMGERLIVEDVWFTGDNNDTILLYLRNVGKVSIKVAAVYVNREDQPFTSLELEQNKHGWLNVAHGWSADSAYEIKVVTRRGTQVVDYYMSPS
jgi:flagellin-like protein